MAQGRSTEIITMIKWIRTSRLSIKELSLLSGTRELLALDSGNRAYGGTPTPDMGRGLYSTYDVGPDIRPRSTLGGQTWRGVPVARSGCHSSFRKRGRADGMASSTPGTGLSSFRSFRYFELPTWADTGDCSVERLLGFGIRGWGLGFFERGGVWN